MDCEHKLAAGLGGWTEGREQEPTDFAEEQGTDFGPRGHRIWQRLACLIVSRCIVDESNLVAGKTPHEDQTVMLTTRGEQATSHSSLSLITRTFVYPSSRPVERSS